MEQLNKFIEIKIIYECHEVKLESSLNDKLDDVINKFSTKINMEKSNLYFLYDGRMIGQDEYKKTILEIMNESDKDSNTLVILAYIKDNQENYLKSEDITILLIKTTKEVITLKGKRNETFKEIFEKSKEIISFDFNKYEFNYRNNKKINLNEKFDDIAVEDDQKLNGLTLYAICTNKIYIKFINEKLGNRNFVSNDEEKLEDLFKKYCSSTNQKREDLIFKSGEQILDKAKTLGDICNENKSIYIDKSTDNVVNNSQAFTIIENNNKEIEINVVIKTCCQKHKKLVIILSIIGTIIVGIIIAVIIILIIENKEKDCEIGYRYIDGECKIDYFLTAIYHTQQKQETIELMNYYTDINYMFIDGKKIEPNSISYQFEEEGDHTVNIQFKKYDNYNFALFRNNKNIKSVKFTNFNEYHINLQLNSIFENCINLYSVDFSQISFDFSSTLENTFNGCINLKYVNIKNVKIYGVTKYMFGGCKSLTSIDLSDVDFSNVNDLGFMFANCVSLQTINLKNTRFFLAEKINCMFLNCYSLKELDFSSFTPKNINYMYSTFYNCSSLTSIKFNEFSTTGLNDMGYLFYNCSSLKIIDISFFNTKDVGKMNNMFEGCKSLTSIKFGPNFNTNNVYSIYSMFSGCHSLKSIDYDLVINNNVDNLSYLFSDCYSLTSINLKNFDVSNIKSFKNMFHNCYSLETIDISNFRIYREPSDLTGMFSGCSLLTSLDLSKINTNNIDCDEIFYDCPKLSYVDISFLRGYRKPDKFSLFNKNISQNGIIIVTKEFHDNFFNGNDEFYPKNWTLNFSSY